MTSKDIVRKTKTAMTRPSALKRAIARIKARQEERQNLKAAQAERVEAAAAPDRYQLIEHYACSLTGQPFHLIWERGSQEEQFTIHAIVNEKAANTQNAGHDGPDEALKEFPLAEFNFAGIFCPCCGSRQSFVYCGCGDKLCGGARQWRDGVEHFRHMKCGAEFEFVQGMYVTSISGYATSVLESTAIACRAEQMPKSKKKRK